LLDVKETVIETLVCEMWDNGYSSTAVPSGVLKMCTDMLFLNFYLNFFSFFSFQDCLGDLKCFQRPSSGIDSIAPVPGCTGFGVAG
jgi:hypothetical protein